METFKQVLAFIKHLWKAGHWILIPIVTVLFILAAFAFIFESSVILPFLYPLF